MQQTWQCVDFNQEGEDAELGRGRNQKFQFITGRT